MAAEGGPLFQKYSPYSVLAGAALAEDLGLEPLPHEGGLFRQTVRTEHLTVIYFMVIGDDFSALHRLVSPEIYFFHAGSPLRMLLLADGSEPREVILGPDNPQVEVPAGTWQGSSTGYVWTLVSTAMSPGFDWAGFELGDRAALLEQFPAAAGRIAELTRLHPEP